MLSLNGVYFLWKYNQYHNQEFLQIFGSFPAEKEVKFMQKDCSYVSPLARVPCPFIV